MNRSLLRGQSISLAVVLAVLGCGAPTPAAEHDRVDLALAACDRAVAFLGDGRYELAIAELQKAIQIHRRCSPAHYNLGWIYATCPDAQFRDGRRAIGCAWAAIAWEWYYDAIGVKGKRTHWMTRACLAAAYAESGEYEKAVNAVNEALTFVQYVPVEYQGLQARETVESRLRALLKLFQAGKPLRTHETALSRVSDDWVDAIMDASDPSRFPEVAEWTNKKEGTT